MTKKKFNANLGQRTKKSKNCTEQLKKWTGKLVYVNEKGTYAEDEDGDPVVISEDVDGNIIGTTTWDEVIRIDEAVAVAWKKRPYDGTGYYVSHIDGNKSNCSAGNLEWIPVSGTTTVNDVFINDSIVFKDGTIVVGETKACFEDGWFDDDLDLWTAYKHPQAVVRHDNAYPDFIDCYRLYEKAGYIQGDKFSMKDPAVLHIDGDQHNHHSDNLKWVEKDDPEYVKFDDKSEFLRKQHNLVNNPEREQDLLQLGLV